MSIASELTALNGYILGAYDEINTKGGTVPANKNMANLASAIGSISTGSSTTITPLSVTENGTYTAPTGTAYSPVTVNVSGGGSTDNNWAEVMRHESTQLYDNEITDLAEYQLGTGTLVGNWITSISFPELTTAGDNAFRQQTSVTSMNLPQLATLGSSSIFYRMTALQNIALPSLSTPTRIDLKNTFQLCSALTKVDLGSNSLTFGYRLHTSVFASCSALSTLIIRCPEVVDMYNNASNIFSGTPLISGTGYIYVPSSLVNSYKGAASTKWGAFSSQIRAIEDYSSDGTVNGDINV